LKGSNDIGVDVQYPWADSPRCFHKHAKRVKSFWIDNYPVANAQFKKFLDATHYKPQGNLG
jgi:formylglycine-generating enzyme required for sulfatase activity